MECARDKSHALAEMPVRARLHELLLQKIAIMCLDANGVLPSGPHAMAVALPSPDGSSARLGESKIALEKRQHH